MIEFWMSVALATLGVVVPGIAAVYEFIIKGRKRLGYRVQMDTTATDAVQSVEAGAIEELQKDGRRLTDPTLVLLRIENNGATEIDPHDYAVLDDDKVGIKVSFPGRTVAGMVITELSHDHLRQSFKPDSGLAVKDGTIELPRVPMNPTAHYKVLAALEASADYKGEPGKFPDPVVVGGIKGGVGGGGIDETKSRTGTPRRVLAMIAFLVLVVIAQLVVFLRSNDSGPLDCATGDLTVAGSTAFGPILREAADSYTRTCRGASISLDLRGSGEGLRELNKAAGPGTVAFSDGAKPDGYPSLLPRPIAFFLFTLVINPDAGVQDLSTAQIRRIYAGGVTNWKQIGGHDLPVRLVSRGPDSGTRNALQRRVLDGKREPGTTSNDCVNLDPGAPAGVVRCERASTDDVLQTVAATDGAMGYSELSAATGRKDVTVVRIDGRPATLQDADHGAYPFWETEFGYTFDEPDPHSLAASFLRYLTDQVGADILRKHGNRSCQELANPALCRPS
jgi:phosphate transport system substrate-binding protein